MSGFEHHSGSDDGVLTLAQLLTNCKQLIKQYKYKNLLLTNAKQSATRLVILYIYTNAIFYVNKIMFFR